MNAASIFLGLLIVLFMTLLLQWMRKLKPQVAGFGLSGHPKPANEGHLKTGQREGGPGR